MPDQPFAVGARVKIFALSPRPFTGVGVIAEVWEQSRRYLVRADDGSEHRVPYVWTALESDGE